MLLCIFRLIKFNEYQFYSDEVFLIFSEDTFLVKKYLIIEL